MNRPVHTGQGVKNLNKEPATAPSAPGLNGLYCRGFEFGHNLNLPARIESAFRKKFGLERWPSG
jgi:hypothetical protein